MRQNTDLDIREKRRKSLLLCFIFSYCPPPPPPSPRQVFACFYHLTQDTYRSQSYMKMHGNIGTSKNLMLVAFRLVQCLGELEVCFPNIYTHTLMLPFYYRTVYIYIYTSSLASHVLQNNFFPCTSYNPLQSGLRTTLQGI